MISRRVFLKYSVLAIPGANLSACGGGDDGNTYSAEVVEWPISKEAYTTAERQVFPTVLPTGAPLLNPAEVPQYAQYGYSAWHADAGSGLSYVKRTELAPLSTNAINGARLLSFFVLTDIHLVDKESPAQPFYGDWVAKYGASSTGGPGGRLLSYRRPTCLMRRFRPSMHCT